MATNRPMFVQYDIPEVPVIDPATGLQRRDAHGRAMTRPVIENPSDELWRAGAVRITLSCWLIMEDDLYKGPAMRLINRLTNAGVRHYQIPFDSSARGELRAMAMENIRREIREHMERATATRAEAEIRLADETDANYARRRRAYLGAARSIERRVTELLARVGPAAERFGITATDLGINSAAGDVEVMSSAMRERARTFAVAHGILTRRAGGNHVVTVGMNNGTVPPQIAADYLQDFAEGAEENNAAEELRSAFGPLGEF